jgi:electron transfer flavoprotein beta subunit
VLDPFGEYAVEAALKLKDALGGKITSITMGAGLLREVVKKPLAMGADELIMLEDEVYTGADSWTTAYALAAAVRKTGDYDIVLCGREASDTNAGQTGPGIAAILGLPCVTLARKIDITGKAARIERVTATGYEVVESPLPLVITVSNEIGEPRYPNVKGIMAARKVEPVVWNPADIGLDAATLGSAGRRTAIRELSQPVFEGECEMAGGDTVEAAAADLAVKLREAGIL